MLELILLWQTIHQNEEDNDKLTIFERKMELLQKLLHDGKHTEFSVVTIPTEVAVSETSRLLDSLKKEGILVRRVIVNQMITAGKSTDVEAANAYLNRLRAGQRISLDALERISKSTGVELVQVPYYAKEVRTVYGLRMIGMALQI